MRPTLALVAITLRAIPQRPMGTAIMVIGIAGVVGVLTSIEGLRQGLETSIGKTGRDDRGVVLSGGAGTIGASSLGSDHLLAIEQARVDAGSPPVGYTIQVSVALQGLADDGLHAVVVRGLSPAALKMRPEIRLVEGRMFQQARFEAIAGKRAQGRFRETRIGDVLSLDNVSLSIVGIFESDDWYESGFVADADMLKSVYSKTTVNSALVRGNSNALGAMMAALNEDPLEFEVMAESEYYARVSRSMDVLLGAVSRIVGIILAVGGSACAMNVMFIAVSERETEMATVRAIGFPPWSAALAIMAESLVLALVGAAIGAAVAWGLLDRASFVTGNASQSVVNQIDISLAVLVHIALWAIGMGLIGALVPAWLSARQSIQVGLRPQ